MIKTIEQLDREFMAQQSAPRSPLEVFPPMELTVSLQHIETPAPIHIPSHTNNAKQLPKNHFLFRCLAICATCMVIFILVLVFLQTIFGYSWFRVVSGSMQREIPEGSLIVTRRTNEDLIKVGDTIAYERKDKSVITHKVVGIIENFGGSEFRGFETKGTENSSEDPFVIPSSKVVGVVVWSAPSIGSVLITCEKVLLFLTIILIIIIISSVFIHQIKKAIPCSDKADTKGNGGVTIAG